MGAWIETHDGVIDGRSNIVAPLVGAWIETLQGDRYLEKHLVAPLVGAWIETSLSPHARGAATSRPSLFYDLSVSENEYNLDPLGLRVILWGMRWLIAILMTFSLWTESHAIAFSSIEVKQSCCCHQDQPICPATRSCSTVTVVPRVVQERVASQSIFKQSIRRVAIPSVDLDSKRFVKTISADSLNSFSWCENFTAPVSWHDYLGHWLT